MNLKKPNPYAKTSLDSKPVVKSEKAYTKHVIRISWPLFAGQEERRFTKKLRNYEDLSFIALDILA